MLSNRFKFNGKECEELNEFQFKAKTEILEKIDSDMYQFENINCPICKSNNKKEISQKDKYGLPHEISLCKDCGFLYASKRLDQESYNDFYIHHFNDLDIGYSIGFDESFKSQYNNAKNSIYPFIKEKINLSKTLNILEVGCSSGGTVSFFKELGHNVVGLDLGIDAIYYGKESHSLNLLNIDLPDFETDIKFDLIIYNSVFEHISDLDSHLAKIKEILVDDGKLFLRVPGIYNLHKNSFHKFDLLNFITLPHIYYFSIISLSNLLKQYGLKKIKSNEIIFSLFQADTICDEAIISDYEKLNFYLEKENNIVKIKIRNLLFKIKGNFKSILVKFGLFDFIKNIIKGI